MLYLAPTLYLPRIRVHSPAFCGGSPLARRDCSCESARYCFANALGNAVETDIAFFSVEPRLELSVPIVEHLASSFSVAPLNLQEEANYLMERQQLTFALDSFDATRLPKFTFGR